MGPFDLSPLEERGPDAPAAVLDLWTREAGLALAEAQRRLSEVLLVATAPGGELAGVTTAYTRHHPQLGLDLWHFRGYVAEAHRQSEVALSLFTEGVDLLRRRYAAGEDRRAVGVLIEVEHPGLKRAFTDPSGPRAGFVYVGENERGDHVRVKYFPGATAPGAPEGESGGAAMPGGDLPVETVRGTIDAELAEELVRFWTASGALDEGQAHARVAQVTCVVRDDGGALAGTSSAFPTALPLIGGWPVWVFRSFVLPGAAGAAPELLAATFAALEAESEPGLGGPIGVCALLSPEEVARRPEAAWERPPMVHAGRLPDGRQVRVGYFPGASIARE